MGYYLSKHRKQLTWQHRMQQREVLKLQTHPWTLHLLTLLHTRLAFSSRPIIYITIAKPTRVTHYTNNAEQRQYTFTVINM